VRVVTPTTLLLEAAEVLDGIRDDVVVIGAVAVQVALDGHEVALTPTRDVDAGVATDAVERVVAHLEARGLRPSELPSEPPDADPHVRWCGGRRGEPGAYPIEGRT
jgi:hypothetical protein